MTAEELLAIVTAILNADTDPEARIEAIRKTLSQGSITTLSPVNIQTYTHEKDPIQC